MYDVECFIQTFALYTHANQSNSVTMRFSGNTAANSGQNLYGGLLDRCIPSQFAEVYMMLP